MKKIQVLRYLFRLFPALILFSGCELFENLNNLNSKVADHNIVDRIWEGAIAETEILNAVDKLHIAYGHTSHGSQITDGMSGLVAFANEGNLGPGYSENLFSFSPAETNGKLHFYEGSGYSEGDLDHDAGYYPDWINETAEFLENSSHSGFNVIMWSWCGQLSGYSEDDVYEKYLNPMSDFEDEYPNVVFVYMTGHLDGSGPEGTLNRNNEIIREYCTDNSKWLFDFADIESYDPDGNCYLDRDGDDACNYSGGNWAQKWQLQHAEGEDWYSCGSAHSEPLNANMKAYAAWWLFCRIASSI